MDPAEITAKFRLKPQLSWKAGKRRHTPDGRALQNEYPRSFWSYSQDCPSKAFFKKVDGLVRRLRSGEAFLRELSRTGGQCEIYIQLPGSANIGDSLDSRTLRSLGELNILLSVEVFPHWNIDAS